jgi:hypothetical protein
MEVIVIRTYNIRRLLPFTIAAFVAMAVAGCDDGGTCSYCDQDADCEHGTTCEEFDDGQSRCADYNTDVCVETTYSY